MRAVMVSGMILFAAVQATAASPPRDAAHQAWIVAKCAFCHGDDGAGNTDQGKKSKVPDLRSASVQKMSDELLAKTIRDGHLKMPSFKNGHANEQMDLLITYIRRMAKAPGHS